MTTQTEIKLTKKMQTLLKRYGIVTRKQPTTLKHFVSGKEMVCSPTVFAVYELALNSNFAATTLAQVLNPAIPVAAVDHYRKLARLSTPPIELSEPEVRYASRKIIEQHSETYHACCQCIAKAGIYYELLD